MPQHLWPWIALHAPLKPPQRMTRGGGDVDVVPVLGIGSLKKTQGKDGKPWDLSSKKWRLDS